MIIDLAKNIASGVLEYANSFKNETHKNSEGKQLAFSFGDPEPVLSNSLDYLGVFMSLSREYYMPPVSLEGLGKTVYANGHHQAILEFKANMTARWFTKNPLLAHRELRDASFDFNVYGNAYFQVKINGLRGLGGLSLLPALTMRRGEDPNQFFQISKTGSTIKFKKGEVVQLKNKHALQGVYGIPSYFGGLFSVLLSEAATLFRIKYYRNGACMGYILVTTDAGLSDATAQKIEDMVLQSKGFGNWRSMYLNLPRSSNKEPVKVIPVGDIAAKDEYEKIKNVGLRDLLGMHRMQPGLAGVIPENTAGLGDLLKTMGVYTILEVIPMQQTFIDLNDILSLSGNKQIKFDTPDYLAVGA